jgi:hypothetical protein
MVNQGRAYEACALFREVPSPSTPTVPDSLHDQIQTYLAVYPF